MRVSEVKHANSDTQSNKQIFTLFQSSSECTAHSLTIFKYSLIKLLKKWIGHRKEKCNKGMQLFIHH